MTLDLRLADLLSVEEKESRTDRPGATRQVDTGAPRLASARLERFLREHFRFVWQSACLLGLSEADADDVTQTVLMTAARRFNDIETGRERAFLYRTTYHVVSKVYRGRHRRREEVTDDLSDRESPQPTLDALLDRRRAHDELRRILAKIPEKLRHAFILFEIEGWTQVEISDALGIAQGTVASRVRRARRHFERLAAHRSDAEENKR